MIIFIRKHFFYRKEYFITCSQPKYDIIMYDRTAVGFHTFIYGKKGSIMVCTLVMADSNAERVRNVSLCNIDGVSTDEIC